jgi:cytochrome P450
MYNTTSMPREGVFVNNLLSATDEKWHDWERRFINSAFSLTQIIRYEPWVDGTIALFLNKMRTKFSGKEGPDGVIDFMEWLGYFSADVISEMTFGERTGFLEAGKDVDNIIGGVRRVFAPWLYVRYLRLVDGRRLIMSQFSRMPILDKLTFKNPLLLWFNRHGWFNIRNPLYPIVKRQFTDRKQHWEDAEGRPTDREVLSDRFLLAKKQHPEDTDFQPLQHSITMVVAGSETT